MARLMVIVSLLVISPMLFAAGSEIKVLSQHDIEVTQNRYIEALKQADIPIRATREFKEDLPGGFARTGKEIEFSNPYYGWKLGECHRGERKDKPLKARIWEDNKHRVWLEYTAPEAEVNKFGVIECGNEADLVRKTLIEFADSATE